MGAWGIGILEDDTSLDYLDELIDSDPNEFIEQALSQVSEEYLEYDQCCQILVASLAIDGVLNGCQDQSSEEFVNWVEENKSLKLDKYKDSAIKGLKRVLSESSELNELWSENEEDYPNWKKNIENMISRLQKR